MNRSERALAMILDNALDRRAKTIRDADELALKRLHDAGLNFRTIGEAVAFRKQQQEVARGRAAFIDTQDQISRRKAS